MAYGLRDGKVVLLQISGGGRIRVGDGKRKWWENSGKRQWRVEANCDEGQTYDAPEQAEQVAVNLQSNDP